MIEPGMTGRACHPSSKAAEAGGSQVPDQPRTQMELCFSSGVCSVGWLLFCFKDDRNLGLNSGLLALCHWTS